MTYDLIIFDCDGTLVDTEHPVNEAFLHKLRELSPPDYQKFDVDYILKNCIGGTVNTVFDRMEQDVTNIISPENRKRVIAEYQDIVPDYLAQYLKPDPVLIGILEKLPSHVKKCVASNGMTQNVTNSMKAAGLAPIFGQNIFTAEHVPNPKPAPDLILHAAQQMGVNDLSRVLHIEDAPRGAMAGIAAGANVIGFTGHAKDKIKTIFELKQAGVTKIFDNWTDVAKFILNN